MEGRGRGWVEGWEEIIGELSKLNYYTGTRGILCSLLEARFYFQYFMFPGNLYIYVSFP